jgi:hypothetical protein
MLPKWNNSKVNCTFNSFFGVLQDRKKQGCAFIGWLRNGRLYVNNGVGLDGMNTIGVYYGFSLLEKDDPFKFKEDGPSLCIEELSKTKAYMNPTPNPFNIPDTESLICFIETDRGIVVPQGQLLSWNSDAIRPIKLGRVRKYMEFVDVFRDYYWFGIQMSLMISYPYMKFIDGIIYE